MILERQARSGLDRLAPQQEVAPEDQPPHTRAGQERRGLLPHLAGSQGRIKNYRHEAAGFLRIPASAANRSEGGKRGPEHSVADRSGELGGQLVRQIEPGQSRSRQDTARAQCSGQAGQDLFNRCVMQRADGHDGVIPGVRQRLVQDVGEDARDIGRYYPPGRIDHGRGAVKGVDDVLEGDTRLVRGGELDPDILRADAQRYYDVYASYGISVFAVRSLSLEEMAQQVPLVRFRRITIITARELAGPGLRLEPTGRNPRHYTVSFENLEQGVKALTSCAHEVVTNPYHDG